MIQSGKKKLCDFVYDGNWGDAQLVKHQEYHNSLEHIKKYTWLGFEQIFSFDQNERSQGSKGKQI